MDISANESIQVAIKAVKHENPLERQNFVREMCVMSKMFHPNIVRLYGLVLKGKKINHDDLQCTDNNIFVTENLIVLEYMHFGDLGTFLKVSLDRNLPC